MDWKRQNKESDKAYASFRKYLDMGGSRSIDLLADSNGNSKSIIIKWAKQWRWDERAEKFDNSLNRICDDNEYENRKDDMENEDSKLLHEELSRQSASALRRLIGSINRRIDSSIGDFEEMTLDNMVKSVTQLAKLLPEILSSAKDLATTSREEKSTLFANLPDSVKNDEIALNLAVMLLRRISELEEGEPNKDV